MSSNTEDNISEQQEPLSEELPIEAEPKQIPPNTAGAWKFNFRRVNKQLSLIISLLVKLGGVALVIILFLAIRHEFVYKGYSLQEVQVPSIFEEHGFSGPALAVSIEDNLNQLTKDFKNKRRLDFIDGVDDAGYSFDEKQSELEINMVGIGLPIRSFINYVASSLGFSKKKKIKGYFSFESGQAFLKLYIDDQPTKELSVNLDSLGMKQTVDQLSKGAAEHILKITNPTMLAFTYYTRWYKDPSIKNANALIELCEYAIKSSTDSILTKPCYLMWGYTLAVTKQQPDEGAEKVQKALRIDPGYLSGYYWLLGIYDRQNNWKEYKRTAGQYHVAIQQKRMDNNRRAAYEKDYYLAMWDYFLAVKNYDSALFFNKKMSAMMTIPNLGEQTILSTSEAIRKNKASTFNRFAFVYSESGRYDSALFYANQCLAVDSNFVIVYPTLAEIYAYQNQHEKFYLLLEESFKRGYATRFIDDTIRPYSYYRNEKRFMDLLKKYH